jgi:hypothetical protein
MESISWMAIFSHRGHAKLVQVSASRRPCFRSFKCSSANSAQRVRSYFVRVRGSQVSRKKSLSHLNGWFCVLLSFVRSIAFSMHVLHSFCSVEVECVSSNILFSIPAHLDVITGSSQITKHLCASRFCQLFGLSSLALRPPKESCFKDHNTFPH